MADILGLDVMRGVRVRAGHDLRREVRWVHTWPEVLPWLHGGELLLTTGYSWPPEADEQRRIVRDLERTRVAALLFRVGGPFFPQVPDAVVDEATHVGLPVLETGEDASFVELTETLNREIIRSQVALLERSEQIHRTLTAAALDAESVADIAARLDHLIDCDVLILDRRMQPLSPPIPAWDQLPRHVALTVAAEGHAARLALEPAGEAILQPVRVGRDIPAVMLVATRHGRPLTELDRRATEHSAVVVGLHLLRQQAVADVETRVRNTFVEAVLQGRLERESALRERAQLLGFDPDGTYAVGIVIPVDGDGVVRPRALTSAAEFASRVQLGQAVQHALEREQLPVLMAYALNQVVVILPAGEPIARRRERFHRIWRTVQDAASAQAVAVVLGGAQRGPAGAPVSFRQAQAVLPVARGAGIWWYEDLAVLRILDACQDRQVLQDLYDATVGVLRAHSAALYDTARTLIAAGFNQRLAARRLGVHWNTMRNRLARMEALLGGHLDDPALRLRVQLAFEIESLLARG
ncbi:MAG: PucR family transcriptional regulator ligand-binding domain-containing protein [Armatimonadota bacterium]|nr:PucR family transcriptional regulator ligand-binding domain-containing protein [Armatimonadota bacterium]